MRTGGPEATPWGHPIEARYQLGGPQRKPACFLASTKGHAVLLQRFFCSIVNAAREWRRSHKEVARHEAHRCVMASKKHGLPDGNVRCVGLKQASLLGGRAEGWR